MRRVRGAGAPVRKSAQRSRKIRVFPAGDSARSHACTRSTGPWLALARACLLLHQSDMARIKRILCPIDFSEFSRQALGCAIGLAHRHKARVIALHVFANWPAVDVVPSLRAEALQAISLKDVDRAALLCHLKDFIGKRPADVEVEARLEEATDVHREILSQATALHADLIVIGSHGRSGFERVLLGSITEKVLRKAHCPVMVVPRQVEGGVVPGAGRFRRILCPMDFSCSARAALTTATAFAQADGAELTVLHVIEVPAALYETPGFDIGAYRAGAEAASRARLSELVPDTAKACRIDVVVAEGKIAHEVLRVAAERDSDLIVMGVHGRHAMDLLLFGSNTHHVIRAAVCPVLTVRREAESAV
jgi:nucleotide-binding universal stress UspA family protein